MPPLDFAAVFDASPNPYMVLDRELRFVAANAAYLRVTGSTRDELIGRGLFDAFPNDPAGGAEDPSVRMLRASFERVLATGLPDALAFIPYKVPRERGAPAVEDRYWSATHTPLFGANGEVEHIVQHTVDVTELHRPERAPHDDASSVEGVLRRAERVQALNTALEAERGHLLRLFTEAPGFVVFLRGPEHVVELANTAYHQLVGHRDLVGKPLREVLPEIEGQGFFEILDRVFQSGQPFVGRAMKAAIQRRRDAPPEDVYIDLLYQPLVESDGRTSGILVQGNDITEQKRLESEREGLAQQLAETIPQQVWTAGASGELDFVNQRVVAYMGVPAEEILGHGWQDRVHPEDMPRCAERWAASLASGDVYEVEFRLRRSDGTYRWHLGRAESLRDASGAIVKWFGTSTDFDEARRARNELEERAAFEEQLIGIVSHDLRNPLNAIHMVALVLLRSDLDEHRSKLVRRLVSSSDRAGRMIRDFLDFSQARTAGRIPIQTAPANIRELTAQVVDEVSLGFPGREAWVEHVGSEHGVWDGDRIAQVIGNLVANAFQHSPAGTPVRVVSRGEGATTYVEVHNAGPSIPAEDRARLFEPFQRGREALPSSVRSIGLGLYITRSIVDAHGGTVDVRSTEAHGTSFVVTLPTHTASSGAP